MDQPNVETPIQSPVIPPPGFYRRHTRSLWLSLITIALAVAALLGYILFVRTGQPEQTTLAGDVNLAIRAPAESVSGSQISYEISFENLSNTMLTGLALEVFYPDGFSFIQHLPEYPAACCGDEWPETAFLQGAIPRREGAGFIDSTSDQFQFADLPPGQKHKLVIVGALSGNVQEIKSLTAKLHYVPQNFASSFLAAASVSTIMLPPQITLTASAPAQLISGQQVRYDIEIANASLDDFENLILELSYPAGFSFAGAIPAPAVSDNSWKLVRLGASERRTITVTGRLISLPGEDVYISAEMFTEKNGQKLSAGRGYAFTRILEAPIRLAQALSGGAGVVLPGEQLQYEVSYENVGDVGLSNVSIALNFDTAVFDLSGARSAAGQLSGRQMIWVPSALPELRVVGPGQKGKFTMQIPLLDENQMRSKNPVAQTSVEFKADTLPERLSGSTLSFKVGANIDLAARADHVSGPVSPVLGETSVYRITFTVKNSVNDLDNAELFAFIPRTDVSFVSQNSEISYSASARSLSWNLGTVPAFDQRTASFDVAITPESASAGGYVLISGVEAEGLDTFTGELVLSQKVKSVKSR